MAVERHPLASVLAQQRKAQFAGGDSVSYLCQSTDHAPRDEHTHHMTRLIQPHLVEPLGGEGLPKESA